MNERWRHGQSKTSLQVLNKQKQKGHFYNLFSKFAMGKFSIMQLFSWCMRVRLCVRMCVVRKRTIIYKLVNIWSWRRITMYKVITNIPLV